MSNPPELGQRAILRYNRLSYELAAFEYVLRKAKPAGAVGAATVHQVNQMLRAANSLFRRHADLPRFDLLDPAAPVTVADLTILLSRLTIGALHFEERYKHLQTVPPKPSLYDSEGLPSPHR
ncbi:hypothetical protein ACFSX5_03480 [Devosia albogilva]|uniref:Uncharacterized protein n=1 Tax=Devosia albogilva TaxID=429726 RepID=A0ABW5QGM4_9HYPH